MPSPLEAIIPATVGALEGRFGPLLEQGWELTVGFAADAGHLQRKLFRLRSDRHSAVQ